MPSTRSQGKGKGKAVDSSERSPLLGSPSRRHHDEDEPPATRSPIISPRIRSHLLTLIIALISVFLAFILFLILLAYSFKPSETELDALPSTAFKYTPPESISVLNVTEDGILLNITLRCGIDADRVLGVQEWDGKEDRVKAEGNGSRGVGAAWWECVRRWTAHRMLAQLPSQAISVQSNESIYIYPRHSSPLLSVILTSPLSLPLVSGAQSNPDWLQPTTFTALAKPLVSTGQLWDFVQHIWAEGEVRVDVGLSRVEAQPDGDIWWAKYGRMVKENLALKVDMPVPRLPGLPAPGHRLNLSSLVSLRSYSFHTNGSLCVTASATIPNFLPDLNTIIPFSLPFAITLPESNNDEETRMAEVITSPVYLGGSGSTINLTMSGEVVADLGDEIAGNQDPPLSFFLQNYMHGLDNPILVRGLSTLPPFAPNSTNIPPTWMLSSLPSLVLPLNFPGPHPPPKIVHSIVIEHMRLSESSGKMTASGTVVAEVELPPGMSDVQVNIVAVSPDILVFDGPSPEDDEDLPPGTYPARAFGHIYPDYLTSTTTKSTDPEHPERLIVSAPIQNVPLEILPGRDKVLSDFVGKVVFKGGAQAGIAGTSDVKVEVEGLGGRIGLGGLPVKGEMWVGRQRGK